MNEPIWNHSHRARQAVLLPRVRRRRASATAALLVTTSISFCGDNRSQFCVIKKWRNSCGETLVALPLYPRPDRQAPRKGLAGDSNTTGCAAATCGFRKLGLEEHTAPPRDAATNRAPSIWTERGSCEIAPARGNRDLQAEAVGLLGTT